MVTKTPQSLTSIEMAQRMTEIDQLLLSDGQWTTGVAARNEDGDSVKSDSPNAVKWCLLGATWKISKGDRFHYAQICMCFLDTHGQPHTNIGRLNDSMSFPEVKDLVRRAKEVARLTDPWTPYRS